MYEAIFLHMRFWAISAVHPRVCVCVCLTVYGNGAPMEHVESVLRVVVRAILNFKWRKMA